MLEEMCLLNGSVIKRRRAAMGGAMEGIGSVVCIDGKADR